MLEIILDVREHSLIEKLNALHATSPSTLSVKTEQLLLGDAAIRRPSSTEDVLLFERKSLTDLLASIKDGRYEEQSHRLIHTAGVHLHNIIYVIEGVFSTLRNPADKKVILSAMTSLSYFKGFSVFRTATVLETAELIWAMTNKLDKEFEKGREVPSYLLHAQIGGDRPATSKDAVSSQQINLDLGETLSNEPPSSIPIPMGERTTTTESYSSFVKKAKRDNITPDNIGEILLCQIPGISTTVAQAILKQYDGSFLKLLEGIKTDPDKLETICTETNGKRRRISSAVILALLNYLSK